MTSAARFRPTFTDLRAEIDRRVADQADAADIVQLIDQFLAAGGAPGGPLVAYDGSVTWLYRDADAEHVAVVGDVLGYDPEQTRMTRIAGTDLFFFTATLPLDAQIAYAFMVDNPRPVDALPAAHEAWLAQGRLDPTNPARMTAAHPLRPVSVLSLASSHEFAPLPEPDDAPVAVLAHVVASAVLGGSKRIWIALPPGFSAEIHRYPVIYCLDGEAYMLAGRAVHALETLTNASEIAPAVLVFVESPRFTAEDRTQIDTFTRFLIEEVVPFVDGHYPTSNDPTERIIGGAAADGAVALSVALARPDIFGSVIAQSPSSELLATDIAVRLATLIGRGGRLPRCYMDVGRYESLISLRYAHALCSGLLTGGASLSYQEHPGDHGFLGWRATLPDAFRFVLGISALDDRTLGNS